MSRPVRSLALLLPLILVAFTFTGCARSPRGTGPGLDSGWTLLGERTVQGRADRDVIELGGRRGEVKRLKLEVRGSSLTLHDIVVIFENGERYSPSTRLGFGKGDESRSIDLPGEVRNIRRVTFRYGNLPGGGKAHVRLFGR